MVNPSLFGCTCYFFTAFRNQRTHFSQNFIPTHGVLIDRIRNTGSAGLSHRWQVKQSRLAIRRILTAGFVYFF